MRGRLENSGMLTPLPTGDFKQKQQRGGMCCCTLILCISVYQNTEEWLERGTVSRLPAWTRSRGESRTRTERMVSLCLCWTMLNEAFPQVPLWSQNGPNGQWIVSMSNFLIVRNKSWVKNGKLKISSAQQSKHKLCVAQNTLESVQPSNYNLCLLATRPS